MDDKHRYMPYPELVEDEPCSEPYRIADSGGTPGLPSRGVTDKVARRLYVPLGADGRPVARHELAHVHWSPLQLPRVRHPVIVLHAVEDARINLGLEGVGIPVRLDAEQRAHVRHLALQDLKAGRAAAFTLRWVASLGTDVQTDLAQAAAELGTPAGTVAAALVARVGARLERARRGRVVAPFRAARSAARELARALAARGALDPAFREVAVELSCCLAAGEDEDSPGATLHRLRARGAEDGAEPGRMRVVEAPLAVSSPALQSGLWGRACPAVEGTRVGGFHRWAVDRAVFLRRGRRGGGTVLIDTSGSMRLADEDIEALVEASRGAALVAIYSGRGEAGELRIVARGGRRAASAQLRRFGSGNVVDLPALGWLARRQRPRIWVSDGRVTGVGDRRSAALSRACADLQRRAGIRRVATAAEAVRLLGGRGA